jgi:hypothetical protein
MAAIEATSKSQTSTFAAIGEDLLLGWLQGSEKDIPHLYRRSFTLNLAVRINTAATVSTRSIKNKIILETPKTRNNFKPNDFQSPSFQCLSSSSPSRQRASELV